MAAVGSTSTGQVGFAKATTILRANTPGVSRLAAPASVTAARSIQQKVKDRAAELKEKRDAANQNKQVGYADDPIFADQSNAIQRALADYQANLASQRAQAGQNYAATTQDLERNFEHTKTNTVNDFADRGMMNSGLYAKQYDENQGDQQRNLTRAAQNWQNQLNSLNQGFSDFQGSQQAALNQAKADAVARAAAKIKVGK